jgi:hypothetical protein
VTMPDLAIIDWLAIAAVVLVAAFIDKFTSH